MGTGAPVLVFKAGGVAIGTYGRFQTSLHESFWKVDFLSGWLRYYCRRFPTLCRIRSGRSHPDPGQLAPVRRLDGALGGGRAFGLHEAAAATGRIWSGQEHRPAVAGLNDQRPVQFLGPEFPTSVGGPHRADGVVGRDRSPAGRYEPVDVEPPRLPAGLPGLVAILGRVGIAGERPGGTAARGTPWSCRLSGFPGAASCFGVTTVGAPLIEWPKDIPRCGRI